MSGLLPEHPMLNPHPRTIGDILKFFEGISFHGVELGWALCDQFSTDYAFNTLQARHAPQMEVIYRIMRLRYPFLMSNLRHYYRDSVKILPAEVLLLSTGVQRNTLLSFPILQEMPLASRMVVFTGPSTYSLNLSCPSLKLDTIPVPLNEWLSAVNRLWIPINRQVEKLLQAYNFGQFQAYRIVHKLCLGIATILRAETILRAARPRLVFSEFDRQSQDSLIIQVARQLGIKSATLVHGLQGASSSFNASLWAPLAADRILVWGNWMRSHFESLGVPSGKILIGGYPRIQPLGLGERDAARQRMLASGWNGRDRIVVLISSSLDDNKSALELFMKAESLTTQFLFVVRPHPQEDLKWYEGGMSGGAVHIHDPRKWTMVETLAAADIVVGSASASCIDAILIGKNVILIPDAVFKYQDIPMLAQAVERRAVMTADSPEELVTVLAACDSARQTDAATNFGRESALYLGRESASRSAAILTELIEER